MNTRNYGQACSVARFLDLLGTRWTLLIIRDLLAKPRQFKELLMSAPTMGPNLLTNRLRQLESECIVEKVKIDREPIRYQLTDKGAALAPVFNEIIRWSLRHVDIDKNSDDVGRPDLLVVVLRALFNPDEAKGLNEHYELLVDGVVISLHVRNGELETQLGHAQNPSFSMETSSRVLDQIGTGVLDVSTALDEGLATIEGNEEAFARFTQIFSNPSLA